MTTTAPDCDETIRLAVALRELHPDADSQTLMGMAVLEMKDRQRRRHPCMKGKLRKKRPEADRVPDTSAARLAEIRATYSVSFDERNDEPLEFRAEYYKQLLRCSSDANQDLLAMVDSLIGQIAEVNRSCMKLAAAFGLDKELADCAAAAVQCEQLRSVDPLAGAVRAEARVMVCPYCGTRLRNIRPNAGHPGGHCSACNLMVHGVGRELAVDLR